MSPSGPRGNRTETTGDKITQTCTDLVKSFWFWPVVFVLSLMFVFNQGSHVFNQTMNPTLADIYQRAFSTPITSISDLQGGGGWSNNYEAWISFKCPGGVVLRQESEFKPDVVGPVRNWFRERFPSSNSLMDKPTNYRCLYHSQTDNFAVRNEWLLYNTRTTDYFYRATGTR